MDEKMKILFVCNRNICQSRMAEAIFRSMLSQSGIFVEGWEINSAGLNIPDQSKCQYSDEQIVSDILEGYGVEPVKKKPKQLSGKDFENYQHFLCSDLATLQTVIHKATLNVQQRTPSIIYPLDDSSSMIPLMGDTPSIIHPLDDQPSIICPLDDTSSVIHPLDESDDIRQQAGLCLPVEGFPTNIKRDMVIQLLGDYHPKGPYQIPDPSQFNDPKGYDKCYWICYRSRVDTWICSQDTTKTRIRQEFKYAETQKNEEAETA